MVTNNLWEPFRFHQERIVSERLRQILNADVLEPVLQKCKYPEEKNYWRSVFEGHSFHLTRRLAPRLHELCEEVKKVLKFHEPVDFFVTNNPTVNAVSMLRESEQESHLIVVHSALIEQFSDPELRFVIGHELGHIIFATAQLRRLLHNLFPETVKLPIPIENLIHLWDKFSEISADRMGFIASPDLSSCVTNFFKLSSGLDLDKLQCKAEDYLAEVDTILATFKENRMLFQGTHPANPIRVKAIRLFSESDSYRLFAKKGHFLPEDAKLAKQMDALVELLALHPDNERDHYRLILIAAGGFLIAGLDEGVSPEEEERIMEYLANFTVDPRIYLKEFLETLRDPKELKRLLKETIEKLLQIDPEERYPFFQYLCQIAIADRKIEQVEVDFLTNIATQLLGMHEIEASRIFVQALREGKFQPRF